MRRLLCVLVMCLVASAAVFAEKRIVASCMDVEAGPTMYIYYPEDRVIECSSIEGNYIYSYGEYGFDVPYNTLLTLIGVYQMNGGDYIHPVQVGTSVLLVRNYE